MEEDITQGLSIPLLPEFSLDIQYTEVAPHDLVSQYSITKFQEIVEKDRITHDQSYRGAHSKTSINPRVITEELTPCIFGHVHRRLIHYIIGCYQHHPPSSHLGLQSRLEISLQASFKLKNSF